MINKPRRAGVMAGAVLAVAAMAGCNPEAKRQAKESAATATDFAKYIGSICKRVMEDPDAKRAQNANSVKASRQSLSYEGQTETCSCQTALGANSANPLSCFFSRAGQMPVNNRGITLVADDHGLRDANHFTVEDLSDGGKSKKTIKLFVSQDDCEVNGIAIDKKDCDMVRTAVVHAVDAIITAPRPAAKIQAPVDPNLDSHH